MPTKTSPLLWALRDLVGLTGTKFGCGMGVCGATCTVWLDGAPVPVLSGRRCSAVGGKKITTIEALAKASAGGGGAPKAWLDAQVVQCGYCQSGQLMSAAALLAKNAKPTDAEIDDAMGGNVCRCGTYPRIRAAIHAAAAELAKT